MAEILRDLRQSDVDDEQVEIGEANADARDRKDLIGRCGANAASKSVEDRHFGLVPFRT